jgi:nuclear pore complex protein Nup133
VHDAGAGELALLVAMPDGKLVYWESVPNAATGDVIRQKSQGLQGHVGGLFSSEMVVDITEAEPDGFILTSSVGRIIHVSVKDPQGRPALSFHYLRSNNASSGGLLDSFKSVFSSSTWKREIAAVRPCPPRGKTNRRCIVANVQGLFQTWDLVRHGAQNLTTEVDAKMRIVKAIHDVKPAMDNGSFEFRVLDFTPYPATQHGSPDVNKVLVMVALEGTSETNYFLVDLTLRESSMDVNAVYPITCSHEPHTEDSDWPAFRPRLLLPSPAHTAFLVFDKRLILVSLGQVKNSPDTQLQQESHELSDPYQDVLYINRDNYDHLVGCTIESSHNGSEASSCLLIAHNFGLAKATAMPVAENESVADRRAEICRSRIEQAVFFGHSPSNLFDFRFGLSSQEWTVDEIETAAEVINNSIVDNESQYIARMMPSMEHQLATRAAALVDLIRIVGKYDVPLMLRWHLLWSAEKVAAAKAIWNNYNDTLATKEPHEQLLLPELIDMISERYKSEVDVGETDKVRNFFIKDVAMTWTLIPWAHNSLEVLWKEGETSRHRHAFYTSQANNIEILGLEAAFEYRERNAEAYGIGTDVIEDGIYQGDYTSIVTDDIWTSTGETATFAKKLADLAREIALSSAQSSEDEVAISDELAIKLTLDNPKLVNLCCQVWTERIRFLKSRAEDDRRQAGEQRAADFEKVRFDLIVGLTKLGLYDDALKLAEKYHDMDALAEVFTEFELFCAAEMKRPGHQQEEEAIIAKIRENTERNEHYFTTYGSRWANAVYDRQIRRGELTSVLIGNPTHHNFLTQYFHDRPDLSALSWMHQVAQDEYANASEDLLQAQREDMNVWNKKIELSVAKLSMLAAVETKQLEPAAASKLARKSDRRLDIIGIEEKLHQYIQPLVLESIDKAAALNLAMEAYGGSVSETLLLKELLRKHFESLVEQQFLDAEELIDTLTLMAENVEPEERSEFMNQRFYHALQLLKLTGFEGDRKDLHLAIIWRRCLLQDDWAKLNKTEAKDEQAVARATESTTFFRTVKLCYESSKHVSFLYTAGSLTKSLEELDAFLPLPPSEIIGSGSDLESLSKSARYAATQREILKRLAADHSKEDKALSKAMDQCRLESWWEGIVDSAKHVLRQEANDAGEAVAQAQRQRDEASVSSAPAVDAHGDTLMG